MEEPLIPVKWKIYRRPNGHADNIDEHLNPILGVLGFSEKGSQFLDEKCVATCKDNIDNLGTGRAHGVGSCLMPESVAVAVEAAMGVGKHRLDFEMYQESDFETFYEERSTVKLPVERLDTEELSGIVSRIQLEKELGIDPSPELTQRRKDALDPNHPQPGVTKTRNKFYADHKPGTDFQVHDDYKKAVR